MLSDQLREAEFAYYYVNDGQRLSMTWRRRKRWDRGFMGHRGAKQPIRQVYLRTLANLTSPAEVRGVLRLVRKNYLSEAIEPGTLSFSDRILPQRYQQVSVISAEGRDILFAEVKNNDEARYSEFHMSAGERTILRISKDVSNLQDALVLIDEVESGLHPYTQQQLMLELQRLALRQRLQIIVASHSPVVLDSVPPEARLFLDRDEQTLDVQMLPPHRDIFQKALYGQSREQLSILCEDEVAEAALLGILDVPATAAAAASRRLPYWPKHRCRRVSSPHSGTRQIPTVGRIYIRVGWRRTRPGKGSKEHRGTLRPQLPSIVPTGRWAARAVDLGSTGKSAYRVRKLLGDVQRRHRESDAINRASEGR